MEDGLLSLKWNNHKSTFFHILSEVRGKHTYTDATLACEGKFYPVHKLVMSTCSDYFAEIFEKTPCKNPVVVLKDIKKSDLDALLDYMYIGEVDVRQSELAGLIKAAECLRIKGLAVPDEDPTKAQKKGPINVPERREDSPPAKRKRRDSGVERLRPVSPPVARVSSHPPPPPSVPSQAPPQLSSVPESLVPLQSSMPPPPSGESRHARSDSQHSSIRPSPDPLRSPPQDVSTMSPRSSEGSLMPAGMIKVEVEEGGDGGGGKDHQDHREEGGPHSELDGDDDASNDFGDYQGHSGEIIEKEEHDQMDYTTDQIPGPSGLQGGPAMLSWGEEGEGGFPHNLFGGDDASAQQASIGGLAAAVVSAVRRCGSGERRGSCGGDGGGGEGLEAKPFVCGWCPYRALRRGDMKKHLRTHTGEKPYQCPACSFRSGDSSALHRHVRARHPHLAMPPPQPQPHPYPAPMP